ncbi:MAG: hypothetical protein Q7U04_05690 [Bacteriovorax sp.]|nr:hypothetical protein [Bacteriovorax sp.]
MEKIIDGILTAAYLVIFTIGTGYSVQKVFYWTRNAALEKAATGLGSLEASTRKMTGGKLDF